MSTKFITTDKHPELKEGTIVFKGVSNYRTNFFTHLCNEFNLQTWISQGYIKEVEEKEYTKSDMIEFFEWSSGAFGKKEGKNAFYNFINQR